MDVFSFAEATSAYFGTVFRYPRELVLTTHPQNSFAMMNIYGRRILPKRPDKPALYAGYVPNDAFETNAG